jgi:hypothetical protein
MSHSFFQRNGLSLTVGALMLVAWSAQAITGHAAFNQDALLHGERPLAMGAYLISGDFWSATFENWESEFLQMGVYVLLTVWFRQRGSAESRPLDPDDEERLPTPWHEQPRAWRAGGALRWLYAHSLSLAFFGLFVGSFVGHLLGSWHKAITQAQWHHQPAPSLSGYLVDPSFWFESFQNWQSEFLAVLALVTLSIYLRQQDSPQSKPVDAPHAQTGS